MMITPLLVVTHCLDMIARSERDGEFAFMFVRVTDLDLFSLVIILKLFG